MKELIYKYMKWRLRILYVLFGAFLITLIVFLNPPSKKSLPCILFSLFILGLYFFLCFLPKAKEIAFEKHGVNQNTEDIFAPVFTNRIRINKIKSHITTKQRHLYSKDKILKLAEMYKTDAESNKFSGIIYKVIFVWLISPVYCEFIGYLLRKKASYSLNDMLSKLGQATVIALLITFMLGIFVKSIKDFIYEICDTKYNKKKRLSLLLGQLYLEMH